MVYKKYIKRNGKTFGPYYYESYREDGKVKTRFISGPSTEKKNKKVSKPNKNNSNKINKSSISHNKNFLKISVGISILLLILIVVGLDYVNITGNVINNQGFNYNQIVNIILTKDKQTNLECIDWSVCYTTQNLDNIFNKNNLVKGEQFRTCKYKENPQINIRETKRCELTNFISAKKTSRCDNNFIELYDLDGNLISEISLPSNKIINIKIPFFDSKDENCV